MLPALQTPAAEEAPHFVLLAWAEHRCWPCPLPISWYPPAQPGVSPRAVGAPTWPSLMCQGLSGVAHEPWGHPGSLPPLCPYSWISQAPHFLRGEVGIVVPGQWCGLSFRGMTCLQADRGRGTAWMDVPVTERRAPGASCLCPRSPHPGDPQGPRVGGATDLTLDPRAPWMPHTLSSPTPPVHRPPKGRLRGRGQVQKGHGTPAPSA